MPLTRMNLARGLLVVCLNYQSRDDQPNDIKEYNTFWDTLTIFLVVSLTRYGNMIPYIIDHDFDENELGSWPLACLYQLSV